MKKYNVKDLLSCLNDHVIVKGAVENKVFTNIKTIFEADKSSLVWVNPLRKDKQKLIRQTDAELIICDDTIALNKTLLRQKCFIIVSNPRLAFVRIVNTFFLKKNKFEIHPTAIIHPESKIEQNVSIGPYSTIGKGTIESGTIIYGNVHIYDNYKIGKNVEINSGTVIGANGFGYVKNEFGEFERFPHIGGVLIEDNVDIGSNTCIDRGTIGNTYIKKGAKIDNFVHIAHNVIIGRNTLIIAHTMIGGSTEIGDNTWIAPSVCIRDAINIGSNVTVGLSALVTKNIPDGEIWAGFPAKKFSK